MNTNTPTHVTFSTPTGPVTGIVLEVRQTGYMVSAFGGQRVFVDYGFVHYA